MSCCRFGILSAFVALTSLSCSGRVRLDPHVRQSVWPFHHGQGNAHNALTTGSFTGAFTQLWETRLGDKPAGPLTCYHDAVVYAGTRKKLRFLNARNGESLGRIRIRGIPQTGVVMADSNLYFALAPPKNSLVGMRCRDGKIVWTAAVKDASPGSIIVDSTLIVSAGEGRVTCFLSRNGRQLWSVQVQGRCVAPPSYQDGMIIQPADNGNLFGLKATDGQQLFRARLKGALVGAVAADGMLFAGDLDGQVYALQPTDGSVVWETHLDGPIWSSPAVGKDRIYVGHSGGKIVALDKQTGSVAWQYATTEVMRSSPLLVGTIVVAGTMSGTLVALNEIDGTEIARVNTGGALFFPPVSDGRRVFVATQEGRVICYGDNDE